MCLKDSVYLSEMFHGLYLQVVFFYGKTISFIILIICTLLFKHVKNINSFNVKQLKIDFCFN